MHLSQAGLTNVGSANRRTRPVIRKTLTVVAATALGTLFSMGAAPAQGERENDVRRDATVLAVEKVMPSVVNINTEEVVAIADPFDNLFRNFFDPYYRRRQPDTQYSLGSGVIIDEEGYVLTNFHVVGRARRVWVTLHDGRVFEAEKVVVNSATDLALVRIRAKPGERFTAIPFADQGDLLLGETVLALGNPFGLGGSVSKGILSSKTRRPVTEKEPLDVRDWLQTDAAINPGNSGGPLTNLRGELIGVNVAVLSEAQGIGFAIPIQRVVERLAEIFSPEALDGLWFGARLRPGPSRLVVADVQPDSPAAKGGLRTNDVILQVNGKAPRGLIDFVNTLRIGKDKQAIALTVQRGRERKTVSVRLAPENAYFNAGLIRQKTGLIVQELTPRLAQTMGFTGVDGLLISEVESRSPASSADLKHGMVVTGIDGQPVTDVVALARRVHLARPGEKVRLDVIVPVQRGSFLQLRQAFAELTVR